MTEHDSLPTPPQPGSANQQPQQFQQYQQYQNAGQLQQPAWQQPQPGNPYAQPPAAPKNGKAIGALVCGILAIVFSSPLGLVLGAVAIVLAILSKKQSHDGKATAGLICGIIGIVLSIISTIMIVAIVTGAMKVDGVSFVSTSSSKSSAAKSTLAEDVRGLKIADDEVCTMTITKIEFDENDDLNVHFKLTDHTVGELTLMGKRAQAWEVNGNKVECVCFTWVKPKQTKEDFFTIPASYLDTNDIDDIYSIIGVVEADIGTSVPMEYKINLF